MYRRTEGLTAIDRYQGILGSCVGLGNSIGPFMAAGFVSKTTWRALFWTICPLACVAGVIVAIILPPSKTTGNTKEKMKTIDYWGTLASSVGVILILIPISGGGTYFPWSSPMVISMLVLGSISMIIFVLVEWKSAVMPMMPLHLFQTPAVCAILIQNFFIGIVYYSHLYFLPIYYQNTHQMTPVKSAALMIPFVGSQAITSILSGQYISRMKRYGEIIWMGYSFWCLGGMLLLIFFNRTIKPYAIAIILIIEGAGVGCVFQPTLVAAQAHSAKEDRAVVISVRNFIRALGGAAGLAISSTIFSNVLNAHTTTLPIDLQGHIRNENLGTADLSRMTYAQKEVVLNAYAAASHAAFLLYAPAMGICILLCVFIEDKGLQRPSEKAAAQLSSSEASIRSHSRVPTPRDSTDRIEEGIENTKARDGPCEGNSEKMDEVMMQSQNNISEKQQIDQHARYNAPS